MAVNNKKTRGRVVNRAELAEIIGVSMPTIDDWVKRGCPVVQRGGRGRAWQFNTAEVRNWREDDIRAESSHTTHATKDELLLRKLAAETEQAELDLAKSKDEVVPVEQLERAMIKAFGEVRAGLRNVVPGRAAKAQGSQQIAADYFLRLSDLGASDTEISRELGDELKTVRSLLDAADYWRHRLGH